MFDKTKVRLLFAAALLASAVSAQADVFNMGGGDTSLSFVTVGNPGNGPDPATGNLYGSVPHAYQMGKFDVTTCAVHRFSQCRGYGKRPIRAVCHKHGRAWR